MNYQPEEQKSKRIQPYYGGDMTNYSFTGIFSYILERPEKKCIFFGEAKRNTWLEMYDFYKRKDIIEEYAELQEDLQNYPEDFILEIVVGDPKYSNTKTRQEALETFQNKFLNENKNFQLYRKRGPEYTIVDIKNQKE